MGSPPLPPSFNLLFSVYAVLGPEVESLRSLETKKISLLVCVHVRHVHPVHTRVRGSTYLGMIDDRVLGTRDDRRCWWSIDDFWGYRWLAERSDIPFWYAVKKKFRFSDLKSINKNAVHSAPLHAKSGTRKKTLICRPHSLLELPDLCDSSKLCGLQIDIVKVVA